MDYSQQDSLINYDSFSKKVNVSKNQILSEERKVLNTDDNNENNNNNYEANPADFITMKGERPKSTINTNNKMNKIKLEDGISINIIKSHGDKRIKKFFHIPDFEIYVIKVINYLLNFIGNSFK